MQTSLVYLHGFASSPGSAKAQMFRDRFEPRGVRVTVPDLNVPSFEKLTLTAMLKRTAETVDTLPEGPVVVVGSSLGGLVAVHFADRYRESSARRVEKMVLLAPAFDFMSNRVRQLGEHGLAAWQERGFLMVPHYAHAGQMLPLHYDLVDDILQYDSYGLRLDIPTLIYHGRQDESVEYTQSVRFATNNPAAELQLLLADHSLLGVMDIIMEGMTAFFAL